MSVWIGKDNNNIVRAKYNSQPVANHLGFTWEKVTEYRSSTKHLLKSLVVESLYTKELTAINYKTELKTGVRLDPEAKITKDGLISEIIYYYENDNEKRPVLKVTETYAYRSYDMVFNPSERGMYSQEKKWQYYFEDGVLDTSYRNTKTKIKIYKTNRQILEVGLKRRTNITGRLSENVGGALVVLGVFTDDANSSAKKKAYDALRNFSREFSTDFTEYKAYATTNLYSSIQNDTVFTWLNTHIPTESEFVASGKTAAEGTAYQGVVNMLGLQDMQGKTIRTYFIEKLKGLVA